MEKTRKMKLGRRIVYNKTIKKLIKSFHCSIVPLLLPIVLLLTSKVEQNARKNVSKSSKHIFFKKMFQETIKIRVSRC